MTADHITNGRTAGPQIYIYFPGTAREALTFYADIFGGELSLHTYEDFSRSDGAPEAIAHGVLSGVVALAGSDAAAGQTALQLKGIMLSLLGTAEPAVLHEWFDKLSVGGSVIDPLAPKPWNASDGQVVVTATDFTGLSDTSQRRKNVLAKVAASQPILSMAKMSNRVSERVQVKPGERQRRHRSQKDRSHRHGFTLETSGRGCPPCWCASTSRGEEEILWGGTHGNRHNEVVQRGKGLWLHPPDDRSGDVFPHYSAIASSGYRSLEENQQVQYDLVQGQEGPQADSIRPP